MEYIVIYNAKANNGKGLEGAKLIEASIKDQPITCVEASSIKDYDEYIVEVSANSRVVLCGGDGTISYYVHHTSDSTKEIDIDYLPTGTGNDFASDLGYTRGQIIMDVNKYLTKLPTVTVKGKEYKFFNGVGYGIDGYCCEVGDIQRASSDKPVNYTGIAIKGLLFHFKSRKATVVIDGKEQSYENVWLVPTMKGRMYGGGMIPTPDQKRDDPEGTLSVMVYKAKTAIGALIVFPKIFKGEHVKKEKIVTILKGKEIKVSFDKPCALQVDGETILDVSEYTVRA